MLTIAIQLRLLKPQVNAAMLHTALSLHYSGMPNIQVMDMKEAAALERLDPRAMNDTDRLRLGVLSNEEHQQVLLFAVLITWGKARRVRRSRI